MKRTAWARAFALLAVPALVAWSSLPARAAEPSKPTVTLDRSQVRLGETLYVTLRGFQPPTVLTIAICGNAARRGSVDCNLPASLSHGVRKREQGRIPFVIATPPTTCPCVIRVSSNLQDIVEYAPITIIGHPTGPIVGDIFEPLVEVTATAKRAPSGVLGWLRSALGGPTTYRLTVRVHNVSAEVLNDVSLRARVGRRANDQARFIALPNPGELEAGETWIHEELVRVPAPVVGRLHWSVAAYGGGPAAKTNATSNHRPILLVLLLIVLAVDVSWYVKRRLSKPIQSAATAHEERLG